MKASILRDLDVALSTLTVLQHLLENNTGLADLYPLSVLAGEGKRKLGTVVDVLSDRL